MQQCIIRWSCQPLQCCRRQKPHHNHRTMQESELWGRCVCVQFFLLTFPQGRWSGLLSIMHQLYWNSINTRGGNAFPILASHSKLVFYPTFWRQAAYIWLRFRSFPQPTKLKHGDSETFGISTWWLLLVFLCSYRSYRYFMFHFFLNCSMMLLVNILWVTTLFWLSSLTQAYLHLFLPARKLTDHS